MLYLLAGLFVLGLAVAQILYGGAMRPVFALPLYLLVGICGVAGLSAMWRKNAALPILGSVLSVLLLAGWLFWRTTTSPDIWLALEYQRLILASLVSYLLFAFVITNPMHRLVLLIGLLVLACIQVGVEVWQFNHRHDSFPLPWFSKQLQVWYGPRFGMRSHGLYLNGNHLVWFLNVSGLFALAASCWGRWRIGAKLILLYLALGCFAGSVLTASRGGLLGLAAGLVAFVLLSGLTILVGAKENRILALAVFGFGAVATVFTLLWVYSSSYIAQGRFSDLLDDSYRRALLSVAAREFQLDPFLGGGAGMFRNYACKFRDINNAADDIYAHNDWAQIAADFGLPALVLLLFVLSSHFVGALRSLLAVLEERMSLSRFPQSHAASLLIAALSSLAVFTVESFFDFNMQIPVNAVLAGCCLGLLANPSIVLSRDRVSKRAAFLFRLAGCLGIAALSIEVIFMSLRAWNAEYAWLRAENAYMRGFPQEALRFAKGGMATTIFHPPLYRLAGLAYLEENQTSRSPWERLENTQAAIQLFSEIRNAAPLDWKNSFQLGSALKIAGHLEEAVQPAVDTIILNPTQAPGFELYGDCLAQGGFLEKARESYRIASWLPGQTHARDSIEAIDAQKRALPPSQR